MRETFIYIIATRKDGAYTDPVKIGISSNPAARLNSLQTGCAHKLELICQLNVGSRDSAQQLEREVLLLASNSNRRMHGEWVNLPPFFAIGVVCAGLAYHLAYQSRDFADHVRRLRAAGFSHARKICRRINPDEDWGADLARFLDWGYYGSHSHH